MKIVVTGASGFVGQYLIVSLRQQNFDVVGVSRKRSEAADEYSVVIPDYSLSSRWGEVFHGCDVVIHLAARVHVMKEDSRNPLDDFLRVNLHGTVNIAKAAVEAGVKRFVYISTVKVNGEFTDEGAFSEADKPNSLDDYAVSKSEAEKALLEIAKTSGMEVVILRPPLVYGAGVKANFAALMRLVKSGVPLPFAGINNKRSMIYLGNLVDAITLCAMHPNAAGQLYLVSDGQDVSTPELAQKLAYALKKPDVTFTFPQSWMRFMAGLLGKSAAVERLTQSLVIDSSKIRRELDWQPPYTLDEGLQLTADWFMQQHDTKRRGF